MNVLNALRFLFDFRVRQNRKASKDFGVWRLLMFSRITKCFVRFSMTLLCFYIPIYTAQWKPMTEFEYVRTYTFVGMSLGLLSQEIKRDGKGRRQPQGHR